MVDILHGKTMENFYSHAHEGRDFNFICPICTLFNFYSHAHEGRDFVALLVLYSFKNFYSHAHEGRDIIVIQVAALRKISTHTPTRGVTNSKIFKERWKAFLLTRPRGA